MISAGALNDRVAIEVRTQARDGIGQPVLTWSLVSYAWANVLYPSGLSTIRAGAEIADIKVSIRMRYRTDITEAHRIRHGADLYDVQAVLPNKAKGYVDLLCKEVK
ncbi:MAG: hypothetical protein H6R14_774 [Proteobacteria bacterium]|nr:hypothetical protein [Pseudomonadota bacterium]